MSLPTPNFFARLRVVQCVEVSSGVSLSVTRTTSATFPSGRYGLRPRPFAITPTKLTPLRAYAARQARTVFADTPLPQPPAATERLA